MPFYDPKAHRGKGPQAWNPDWGFGSELMGTFRIPKKEDPDRFKLPATDHKPLSYHKQMFGGIVVDPETGEKYHSRLQAPPEPQGIQSWHHGIMEGEWHDTTRTFNNYFAKLETSPWTATEDLGNVPVHILQQNGYIEDPIKTRAMYAGGPPTMKSSFPGLRELPAAYGGEYDGFHKKRHFVAPDPITGKELRPANLNGRMAAPVGAQRIRAMPHESIQVSKGKDSGTNHMNYRVPHRLGGVPHAGNPLIDSMRSADEIHTNQVSSSESLDQIRNQPNAGQLHDSMQHSSLIPSSQPLAPSARDDQYSLMSVKRRGPDQSQLQRVTASRQSAPDYSVRRDRVPEPVSRVSLMRFGKQPVNWARASQPTPAPRGSTRLSAEGTDPDYTSITTIPTTRAVSGFHPMESLTDTTNTQVSTTLHMASGYAGAGASSKSYETQEGVGEYTVEAEQYVQPETSVRQSYAARTTYTDVSEDLYKDYVPTRNPETSLRQQFPPAFGDHDQVSEVYGEYVPTRNPETSLRQQFRPTFGDHAQVSEVYGDYAPTRNPETSVRQQFRPAFGDYVQVSEVYGEYVPTRNPETSVRQQFQPLIGDQVSKPQGYIPSAGHISVGHSGATGASALPYMPAIAQPKQLRLQMYNRGPHGTFKGQLHNQYYPAQVHKSTVDKAEQFSSAADNMSRRLVSQTLTNGSIRVPHYGAATPEMQYIEDVRTQLYFPPMPTA